MQWIGQPRSIDLAEKCHRNTYFLKNLQIALRMLDLSWSKVDKPRPARNVGGFLATYLIIKLMQNLAIVSVSHGWGNRLVIK